MASCTWVVIASSMAAVGCGAGAPAATPLSNQPMSASGFVAWMDSGHGPQSRWLDADGVERGSAAGQYVVRAGRLARVTRTEIAVPLTGCSITGDSPIEPATGHGDRLTVVDVADPAAIAPLTLAEPGPDGDGLGELDHGARVRGGLGRFVMIEESTYVFGCGAHGNNAVAAHLIDLSAGATVPWPLTDQDIARFAPEVIDGLRENGFLDDTPAVHFGESLPVWRNGAAALRHLLWLDTCYACGNGEWSSYTSGSWVVDAHLPPAFAAEAAAVPPAVAQVLTAMDGGGGAEVGVSWGTPDERWAATFSP